MPPRSCSTARPGCSEQAPSTSTCYGLARPGQRLKPRSRRLPFTPPTALPPARGPFAAYALTAPAFAAGHDHRLGFEELVVLSGEGDLGPQLVGAEVPVVDQEPLFAALELDHGC